MNFSEIATHYRVIALDGCDGTGKTTIATQLATEHGYTIVHSPRTPEQVDLTDRYRQILARPGRLVLDRCFVSELVYGPLRRGRSRLTWDDTIVLATCLTESGGVFVHLTGTPSAIRARLLARDDPDGPPTDIEELLAGYNQVFAALTAHGRVIHVEITSAPGASD